MGLVLIPAALSAPGVSAGKRGPLVLHLRWRRITAAPSYVAANDRYVAIIKDRYPAPSALTLIDEQTGKRQGLVSPGCTRPFGPMFGGPWLFVTCSYGSYELYSLTTHSWRAVRLSAQCSGVCNPVAVGRYWIKIDTDEGPACGDHCGNNYLLQNISTGELKGDPVTAGGRTFDDLNAVSGSAPLCAPLRYPRMYNGAAQRWEPGLLSFDGRFALSEGAYGGTDVVSPFSLVRCGSSQRRSEWESAGLLSSRAMIWTHRTGRRPKLSFELAGWLLPNLQRFTAALPAPRRGRNGGVLVALSGRTVLVQTDYHGPQLWAATLPRPARAGRR